MSTNFRRDTAQRRAIRESLKRAGRPLSLDEIRGAAKSASPGLGLATVYRTMNALVSAGEAKAVELPGSAPRYELVGSGHHHHHFHCTRCDRVFELEGCLPGVGSLVPKGFRLASHELFLEGLCDSCR